MITSSTPNRRSYSGSFVDQERPDSIVSFTSISQSLMRRETNIKQRSNSSIVHLSQPDSKNGEEKAHSASITETKKQTLDGRLSMVECRVEPERGTDERMQNFETSRALEVIVRRKIEA